MRYVSTSQGTYVREIVTIYAISFAFRVEKGVLLEVCFGSTTEIVYIGMLIQLILPLLRAGVTTAYETVDGSHWVPSNWIETWAGLENSVSIQRGSRVDIACVNPGKAFQLVDPRFFWTNGQAEKIADSRFGVAESGALTIEDAQPRDSNKYTCRVTCADMDTDTDSPVVKRKEAWFYHHLVVFTLPEFSLVVRLAYFQDMCGAPSVEQDSADKFNEQLCDTTICLFKTTAECHPSTVTEETGEKKLEYELVFNIVHRLHDDYRPPMCNVPCRNKAVWDELQKGYMKVKNLAKKEAMRGKRIQNQISKTLKLRCLGGYELHHSSICLPCIPGTSGAGGDTACRPCKTGWYQTNFASSVCTECPQGMATHENGSVSLMQCIVPKAALYSVSGLRKNFIVLSIVLLVCFFVVLLGFLNVIRKKVFIAVNIDGSTLKNDVPKTEHSFDSCPVCSHRQPRIPLLRLSLIPLNGIFPSLLWPVFFLRLCGFSASVFCVVVGPPTPEALLW
ncbi:hypothetical protein LSAT2_009569 [Lamellibrachia satsuma]|nr:hypothetical protein LSAT2_009569 [Lamellibrachia satsuma]